MRRTKEMARFFDVRYMSALSAQERKTEGQADKNTFFINYMSAMSALSAKP